MTKIIIDEEDFNKKLNLALEGIKFDLVDSMQNKLTQEHGRDTSALSASIPANSFVEGADIIIGMAEHGAYVEFGTLPHMPPVDELEGWAMRKLGDKDLKWALAYAIKKRGTRPYPFIRTTFQNELRDIVNKNLIESFK
jgi:hypothetical protein